MGIVVIIKNRYKLDLLKPDTLRLYWFLILVIVLLSHCICNWEEVIILLPLNGEGLILMILLSLCVLPFFKNIDITGVSVKIISVFDEGIDADKKSNIIQKTSVEKITNKIQEDIQEKIDSLFKINGEKDE